MNFRKTLGLVLALVLVSMTALSASAAMQFTEWMYKGDEFIEITNTGPTAIDMTGWSFDDDSRVAGTVSLSSFGLVAAGESVIISEAAANDFRTLWGLSASIKVLGKNTTNLGGSDEINLYNAGNVLVDRLTYTSAVVSTLNVSGNVPVSALGLNDQSKAVLSYVGDIYGSRTASAFVANPGTYPAIPEPASMALLAVGGLMLTARRR